MNWFLFITFLTTQTPIVVEGLKAYPNQAECVMDASIVMMDFAGSGGAKIKAYCLTEEAREEMKKNLAIKPKQINLWRGRG